MELLKRARFAFLIAMVVAGCRSAPQPGSSSVLAVAGRANAFASIAADNATVAVVWGATATDTMTGVFAAVSRDAGRSFGAPVRVSDVASLSGEQPPRVTLVPRAAGEPAIVVVWTATVPAGSRLLTARSDDGGRSFGRAEIVPGTDDAGNRGWQSTAADRDGRVVAIWLDHRELATPSPPVTAQAMAHDGQAHVHGGASPSSSTDRVARAQLSKLYVGRIDAATETREVTGGVCYCCKTALAIGSDGALFAAWRHVYAGNIRDIAFAASRDGGRTFTEPVRVSDDEWVLDGCPENGPAMAVDAGNRIHLVWPTLVNQSTADAGLALFHATSIGGAPFSARQRMPTEGTPSHPQLAVAPAGQVLVVWDEAEGGVRRIAGARIDPSGGTLTRQLLPAEGRALYPVVAWAGTHAVLAWTSGSPETSVIRVALLP